MAEEILRQSPSGKVVIYTESDEERAERLRREASRALQLTRGQQRVVKKARRLRGSVA